VFFQHPKWFIMPLNHKNLWSIAFIAELRRPERLFTLYFFDIGYPCYDQLTPVISRHPLTSITWPYRGLKFTAHWGHVWFWSWPLTKCWFSIGSQAHVRLICWKKGRIVWKPVNANPGWQVNLIITFSSVQMFFAALFCIYGDHQNSKQKRPKKKYKKPHRKVTKLKSKFYLFLG